MSNQTIINGRNIGDFSKSYLIAEVGTTCLGDLEMALELVDVCVKSGMDAIKFQMIDPEQLSDSNASYTVTWNGTQRSINMQNMFRKLQFTEEQWSLIASRCKDRKIDFFATVDYVAGVDLLEKLDAPAHKIGAWDTTFKPLITRIGQTGKPMFVDLGPTTLQQIDDLKAWYLDAGGTSIIFLHDFHTQNENEMNMAAIRYLKNTQPWPVGYSSPAHDHDLDLFGVGLGATVVEKRLIMSRDIQSFHSHESLEPDELANWVKRIRHINAAYGKEEIIPSQKDIDLSGEYYRSICTTKNVKKGEEFTPDNLHGKRPGTGLSTQLLDEIWGKKASRDLDVNMLLKNEDIL